MFLKDIENSLLGQVREFALVNVEVDSFAEMTFKQQ